MISKPWLYCVALMFGSSFTFAASLENIGHFDGAPMKTSRFDAGKTTTYIQISDAKLLSADGKTVVAEALNKQGVREVYRWTKEKGTEGLGLFPKGGAMIFPEAISDDGSIIAGDFKRLGEETVFIWTKDSGAIKLIDKEGKTNLLGMTADGWGFMGEYSEDPETSLAMTRPKKYYIYSHEKGFQPLTEVPSELMIELFSKDGKVMVSTFQDYVTSEVALLEVQSEKGFQEIKAFKNKTISFEGISKDGHALTGHIYQNKKDIAFRWSKSKGLEFLGVKDRYSYPKAISADGNTVVGRAELKQGKKSEGSRAFMWTEATGMVFLKDHLDSLGVDTQGWVLESAIDVSADGKVILGNGINPEGEKTGFLVHL